MIIERMMLRFSSMPAYFAAFLLQPQALSS